MCIRDSTRADFPDMAPNIVATATYYDARITHAERLGLELLLDGMAANPGSLAVNHLALEGAEGGALLLRDTVGGALHCVEADVVVNAAGASAGPSRLIHGGIKYLETGEFRLVAQSTLERNLLLKNAPHYVKPIETVLPIPSWFGGIVPSIRRFLGRPAKIKDLSLIHI